MSFYEVEFKQAPGDGEGQGSLACCSPWGRKESDMTEQLNNNIFSSRFLRKRSWQCFHFRKCVLQVPKQHLTSRGQTVWPVPYVNVAEVDDEA